MIHLHLPVPLERDSILPQSQRLRCNQWRSTMYLKFFLSLLQIHFIIDSDMIASTKWYISRLRSQKGMITGNTNDRLIGTSILIAWFVIFTSSRLSLFASSCSNPTFGSNCDISLQGQNKAIENDFCPSAILCDASRISITTWSRRVPQLRTNPTLTAFYYCAGRFAGNSVKRTFYGPECASKSASLMRLVVASK